MADDWNAGPKKGMVTDSVVVLAVRKGNPKNIKSWEDLVKPGVEVINAEPVHLRRRPLERDGRLRRQTAQGKSDAEATEFLEQLFKNISVQDKSARDSLATFTGGKGDVLLAYENEAITAQQKGEELDYVIPDQTILIENPVAVPDDARARRRPRRSSSTCTRRRRRSSPRRATAR